MGETRAFRRVLFGSAILCGALAPRPAAAQAQSIHIIGEAVNLYSPCGLGPDLANRITNQEGFLNGMTASGGWSWPVSADWQNANVWDKDFVDSDVNGNGDDDVAFDSTATAISMYSGHGICNDFPSDVYGDHFDQPCTTSSQCTSPGTGSDGSAQTNPGSCVEGPTIYATHGSCIYSAPRVLVSCSPANDAFNEYVDYSDGLVALGESSWSGAWRGVGTNGSVNWAILDISCAVRPGHEGQGLWNAFAGVHGIATLMPTTAYADAVDTPYRGAKFSARWRANNDSSVGISWVSVLNDLSLSEGSACDPNTGWMGGSAGGGRGFAGCGANWVASVAQNSGVAQDAVLTENWKQAQDDALDETGAAWMSWVYICNYDCATYPLTL